MVVRHLLLFNNSASFFNASRQSIHLEIIYVLGNVFLEWLQYWLNHLSCRYASSWHLIIFRKSTTWGQVFKKIAYCIRLHEHHLHILAGFLALFLFNSWIVTIGWWEFEPGISVLKISWDTEQLSYEVLSFPTLILTFL